ncbi:MAG: (2Fe-2S)-binding protein, partial [Desulfobacterales bacterium]
MSRERFIAARNDACLSCGYCRQYVDCARSRSGCIGCGACVIGCPQGARHLQARSAPGPEIGFTLDGKPSFVNGPVSVLDALVELGQAVKEHRTGEKDSEALCGTGGCWSCSVLIDGVLARSCMTPLREGMEIVT